MVKADTRSLPKRTENSSLHATYVPIAVASSVCPHLPPRDDVEDDAWESNRVKKKDEDHEDRSRPVCSNSKRMNPMTEEQRAERAARNIIWIGTFTDLPTFAVAPSIHFIYFLFGTRASLQ